METIEKKPFGLQLGPIAFSLINLLVILAGSYLIWELFADPSQAVWKLYPQPFNVVLFWSILFVVFFGFMGELWGLGHLPQPARGLLWIALTTVLAVITAVVLLHGYGSLDPAFDISKAGYTGHHHDCAHRVLHLGHPGYQCGTLAVGRLGTEAALGGYRGVLLRFLPHVFLVHHPHLPQCRQLDCS